MIPADFTLDKGHYISVFKKTGQTALDKDGTPLDVWMLSFESTLDGE